MKFFVQFFLSSCRQITFFSCATSRGVRCSCKPDPPSPPRRQSLQNQFSWSTKKGSKKPTATILTRMSSWYHQTRPLDHDSDRMKKLSRTAHQSHSQANPPGVHLPPTPAVNIRPLARHALSKCRLTIIVTGTVQLAALATAVARRDATIETILKAGRRRDGDLSMLCERTIDSSFGLTLLSIHYDPFCGTTVRAHISLFSKDSLHRGRPWLLPVRTNDKPHAHQCQALWPPDRTLDGLDSPKTCRKHCPSEQQTKRTRADLQSLDPAAMARSRPTFLSERDRRRTDRWTYTPTC